MTRTARRALLAVAGAAAVGVIALTIDRDEVPATASSGRSARASATSGAGDQEPVADLRLERLQGKRGELDEPQRDPFRFRPKPPPPAPPPVLKPAAPVAPPPPAGPPPLPPIPLRFIGLVDAPTQTGRLAIVSDGRGNVFYGKEGDTIEGRYRMLRVAPDAIDLAYLDGRGRQTIRLTGQ
jgi:hypothetical protein